MIAAVAGLGALLFGSAETVAAGGAIVEGVAAAEAVTATGAGIAEAAGIAEGTGALVSAETGAASAGFEGMLGTAGVMGQADAAITGQAAMINAAVEGGTFVGEWGEIEAGTFFATNQGGALASEAQITAELEAMSASGMEGMSEQATAEAIMETGAFNEAEATEFLQWADELGDVGAYEEIGAGGAGAGGAATGIGAVLAGIGSIAYQLLATTKAAIEGAATVAVAAVNAVAAVAPPLVNFATAAVTVTGGVVTSIVIGTKDVIVAGIKTIDDIGTGTIKAIKEASATAPDTDLRTIEKKFADGKGLPVATARLVLQQYTDKLNQQLGEKGQLTYKEAVLFSTRLQEAVQTRDERLAQGIKLLNEHETWAQSPAGRLQLHIEGMESFYTSRAPDPQGVDKDHLFWKAIEAHTGVSEKEYVQSLAGQGTLTVEGTKGWRWQEINRTYKELVEDTREVNLNITPQTEQVDKPNKAVQQNPEVNIAVS